MALAYIKPGVTIDEVVTPSFAPVLGEQTSVCLVGPSQGYEEHSEIVLLDDNVPVALSALYPDVDTIKVYDASNLTLTPFTPDDGATKHDYTVDESALSTTGVVKISRSMQTTIDNNEEIIAYYENAPGGTPTQGNSFSDLLTLAGTDAVALPSRNADTDETTISIQKKGVLSSSGAEYTIANAAAVNPTITRAASAPVLRRFQKVWIDYNVLSNEKQKIILSGGPTGGTWSLTFAGQTATGLAHDISDSALATALEALSNIGAGDVSVARSGTGSAADPYIYTVEFINALKGVDHALMTSSNTFTGGTSPGVAISVVTEGGVSTAYTDQPFQLNYSGGTDQAVALPAYSKDHVVKNAKGADLDESALVYSKGTTVDLDYIVTGSNETLTIARSAGTTTMGAANDRLQVKITYRATPLEYWLPTRVFSQADAEDKYGPAFDSDGNISSAVTFGSLLAFENGADSIVIQALFKDNGTAKVAPTGTVADWTDTFESLRNIEDVNVIVPLVQTGGLVGNDATVLSILQEARKHIQYMATVNQYIAVLMGEDSTVGAYAAAATLQSHATTLGATNEGEAIALLTPAAFSYSNPVTGLSMNIGGQYAAACVAGQMAGRPIQETLTRKALIGLTGVGTNRSEREKNEDAESGLFVIESRGGLVRCRHAITTANSRLSSTVTQRELNVVRAKHFVMESVRDALDNQVVGQIPVDENATFTVQLVVANVLERLAQDGVVASYDPAGVQARQTANNPTNIEVRFTYVPSLPLNYISIKFSLDTSTGEILADEATQGV